MPTTYFDWMNGQIISEHTDSVQLDYLTDALGSVTGVCDQTGSLVGSARYKPYGSTLSQSGTQASVGWVGSLGYQPTGLNHSESYMQSRHDSDIDGRWTTVDPLWPVESSFVYATANPASISDPSGRLPGFNPPWLSTKLGAKAKKCLSDALKNNARCKALKLTPQQLGDLYIEMICIMGCETDGPGDKIPNNPMIPDSRTGARGPCRLTSGWKSLYSGDWPNNLCYNIVSGVNLLCFYLQNPGQFNGPGLPRFPWYQDQDDGCLARCLQKKQPGGGYRAG